MQTTYEKCFPNSLEDLEDFLFYKYICEMYILAEI